MPGGDSRLKIASIEAEKALVAGTINNQGGTINVGGSHPALFPAGSLEDSPRKLPPQTQALVGRNEELHYIDGRLRRGSISGITRELSVYGQGGSGKTVLAVAYAWGHLADYPGGAFLVDGSRDDLYEAIAVLSSFLIINFAYDYSGNIAYRQSIAIEVVKALSRSDNRYLLILDGVRNAEQWRLHRASDFLPGGRSDRIITTQDPNLRVSESLSLTGLPVELGIELLRAHRDDVRSKEDLAAARFIVERLGGIPYYVTLVGVYVSRNPKMGWPALARSLHDGVLHAARIIEVDVQAAPDDYARRIDRIMDDLLGSLTVTERRTLEYAVLIFDGEIPDFALCALIEHDESITLEKMPGYEAHPGRYVLERLARYQLIQPRSEPSKRFSADNGLVQLYSIHDILREKVLEDLNKDGMRAKNLLKNVYDALVQSFLSSDPVSSHSDLSPIVQFMAFAKSMVMVLEGLEKRGYVESAVSRYNDLLDIHSRTTHLRPLIAKHKVKPGMVLNTSSGEVAWSVTLSIEDLSEASSLAKGPNVISFKTISDGSNKPGKYELTFRV